MNLPETKHTPGPWIIETDLENSEHIIIVDSRTESYILAGPFNENHRADARLIAAAPELLEALQICSSLLNNTDLAFHPGNVQARLIISKAMGGGK